MIHVTMQLTFTCFYFFCFFISSVISIRKGTRNETLGKELERNWLSVVDLSVAAELDFDENHVNHVSHVRQN